MKTLLRQCNKAVKKASHYLNSDRGLTLKQTFDIKMSFYAKGQDKKPYVSFTASGDYRISVLKLTLILLGIIAAIAGLIIGIRNLIVSLKKRRRKDEDPV